MAKEKKNKHNESGIIVVYHHTSNYIPSKEEIYKMANEKFGHIEGERGASLEIAYWLGLTDMAEYISQNFNNEQHE